MNRNKRIVQLQQELKQMKWAGCSGDQAMDERWDEAIAAVQNRIEQLLSLDAVDTVREVLLPIGSMPPPGTDPSHNPPSHLYIPPGTNHTHTCPSCGAKFTMGAPIMFLGKALGGLDGP